MMFQSFLQITINKILVPSFFLDLLYPLKNAKHSKNHQITRSSHLKNYYFFFYFFQTKN